MNKLLCKLTGLLLILALVFNSFTITAQTKTEDTWTKEAAAKWFAGGEWLNGLKLRAHESTNKVEFATQYHKNKAVWDKAFAFLRNTNLDTISPGKYVIDGDNAFATVTENKPKDFEKTSWESHVKYIDLQYIIRGKEKMGKMPVSKATVTNPYNPAKDVANYTSDEGEYYEAVPGVFLLFFPGEAHRPNVKVAGFDSDKKIVIKIKAN